MLIVVIKYISLGLAGISGIWGLLVEYKDKEGKITKAGRIALSLIVTSTVLAIIMQTLELDEKNKEALKRAIDTQESVGRMEALLNNVNRSVHSFDEISTTFNIWLPEMSQLNEFSKFIESKSTEDIQSNKSLINNLESRYSPTLHFEDREYIINRDDKLSPSMIKFSSDSKYFPNRKDYLIASESLGWLRIILEVYPDTTDFSIEELPEPEIQYWFVTGSCIAIRESANNCDLIKHSIEFDISENRYQIEGEKVKPYRVVGNKANISSLVDFQGKTILISISSWDGRVKFNDYPIGRFFMDFGKGRTINLTGKTEFINGRIVSKLSSDLTEILTE